VVPDLEMYLATRLIADGIINRRMSVLSVESRSGHGRKSGWAGGEGNRGDIARNFIDQRSHALPNSKIPLDTDFCLPVFMYIFTYHSSELSL
jgi:hypothetical protein